MPYYAAKPSNQDRIKYWFNQLKVDKVTLEDSNKLYYCVLTIIPSYVVNTHGRLYFEDLASAEKYLEVMQDKGVYARLERPVNKK